MSLKYLRTLSRSASEGKASSNAPRFGLGMTARQREITEGAAARGQTAGTNENAYPKCGKSVGLAPFFCAFDQFLRYGLWRHV